VLHDLMDAHAPWSNTWIGWMFTTIMLTSTLAALVWIALAVMHAVSGHPRPSP
jgi:hypothetical protein